MHYSDADIKEAMSKTRGRLIAAISSADETGDASSDAAIFIDGALNGFLRELARYHSPYTIEQINSAIVDARKTFPIVLKMLGDKDSRKSASLVDGLFHFFLEDLNR